MVGAMFIRRTQTRRTEDGKPYFSHLGGHPKAAISGHLKSGHFG